MSSTPEKSGPYLHPGQNVLNHLRGLTDPEHAERFEARRINQRIAELSDDALSGEFDPAHLKAIQRYIFQDVYEWAEQFRTVNIFKGGHLFGFADFLESSRQQVLMKLAAENHLVGLDVDTFAGRPAYFLGELTRRAQRRRAHPQAKDSVGIPGNRTPPQTARSRTSPMGLGEATEEADGTWRMKRAKKADSNAFRPALSWRLWSAAMDVQRVARPYDADQEPEMELVGALSLDLALKYMRYRHRDFNIIKAESLKVIALLGGSPLD